MGTLAIQKLAGRERPTLEPLTHIVNEPPAPYVPLTDEALLGKVHYIRGQKVMLDRDLAELYGVEVKRLKEQVRRNMERFPEAFMFRRTLEEDHALRSHFATLKQGEHGKYPPFAFTEHGILMLSNVLKSERAIAVSIRIIDLFVRMREALMGHKDLLLKLERLEKKVEGRDADIRTILHHLRQLLAPASPLRKSIGYRSNEQ